MYHNVELQNFYSSQAIPVCTSGGAKERIELYLDAARKTIEQCIISFQDCDNEDVGCLAKTAMMEIRMAKRLIEYANYPLACPEPEEDSEIDLDEPSENFRRRAARLQHILKNNASDNEACGVIRRLSVVATYYWRARGLLNRGEFSEAERYARSAHLDIDFARQLLTDQHATYSDLI